MNKSPLLISIILLFAYSCECEVLTGANSFGFARREIYLFNDGINSLKASDLNGDSLADIVFINNPASKLAVLLRKKNSSGADIDKNEIPELKDLFDDRSLIVEQHLKKIEIADLNADGLLDIITIGDQLGIVIYYQNKDNKFNSQKFYLENKKDLVDFLIYDINLDSKLDLIVCYKNYFEIYYNKGFGSFNKSRKFITGGDDYKKYFVGDFTGTGIPDFLIYSQSQKSMIQLITGNGENEFNAENFAELPAHSYIDSIKMEVDSTPFKIGAILKNPAFFRLYKLREKYIEDALDAGEIFPQKIHLSGVSSKYPIYPAIYDFNNDGFDDICVPAPELNSAHIYSGNADGFNLKPKIIDSLSGVNSLAVDNKGNILVVSLREKSAAIHYSEALNFFPEIIKLENTPLCCAAIPDLSSFIIAGQNSSDNAISLYMINIMKDNSYKTIKLGQRELNGQPSNIKILPCEKAGNSDNISKFAVIFFYQYNSPEILILDKKDTNWIIAKIKPEDFNPLATNLNAANIDIARLDGMQEIFPVAAFDKTSRVYQYNFNEDSGFKLIPKIQLNAENENAIIQACCFFNDKNDTPGVLVYDKDARAFFRFLLDENSSSTPSRLNLNLQPDNMLFLSQIKRKDNKNCFAYIANESLFFILDGMKSYVIEPEAEYESPVEKAAFNQFEYFKSADTQRIVFIDSYNRALEFSEIITNEKKGKQLKTLLSFETFLEPQFESGNKKGGNEPHSLATGDINGDSLADIVILVHDKLIIYFGE